MKPSARNSSGRDEAIDSMAAAWLAERDDGLTPEAAAQFARWRQADPRHEAAVALLESTWGALQQLQSFRPEARTHPDRNLLARPTVRHRLHFPALVGTAALAASLALVAVWWWQRPAAQDPVFATANNGYERDMLPDGSTIELNAGSEVRVHYTPQERRVHLLRGEAYFIVAKNKARPFWVEAGTVSVRAVGTEFDVSLRPNSVEVLVNEGRVQVVRSLGTASRAALAPPSVAELGVSQRTLISLQSLADAPPIETVSPAILHEELAWEGPRLKFANTPLAEVVAQFNRCNHLQIELADPLLGSQPVGGSFQAQNVEAFVRLLASGSDIVVERPDANHIVLRRAP